ncbi:hypothetical protein RRG08_051256 [Elysia crispata]|uniref:Uncharacterized protein n=1 Tax=Elysia crispata TaxID=231223 RepID=A0AAE1A6M4_9GAST|nr:hypothetical protein RRG08_051256 [Elysia crispata]
MESRRLGEHKMMSSRSSYERPELQYGAADHEWKKEGEDRSDTAQNGDGMHEKKSKKLRLFSDHLLIVSSPSPPKPTVVSAII